MRWFWLPNLRGFVAVLHCLNRLLSLLATCLQIKSLLTLIKMHPSLKPRSQIQMFEVNSTSLVGHGRLCPVMP
jgi:hypothetical protein